MRKGRVTLTASEVRAHLPADRLSRSAVTGIAVAGATISGWVALIISVPAVAPWWLKLTLACLAGVCCASCFVIGHDACHGNLTPYAWLNKTIGRIAFLPALHPYASWEYTHNGLHHGWTNVRGREVAYVPFTKEEFDALPAWRRIAEHFFRSPFGPGVFYFLTVWVRHEIFPIGKRLPPGRRRSIFELDRLFVLLFVVTWLIAIIRFAQRWNTSVATTVLCGFVAELAMFHMTLGVVSFLHHTHPDVPWYDGAAEHNFYRSQVQASVHLKLPRMFELLLHDVLQHTAHHADARIPLYRLAESQACLEQQFGTDIVAEPWSWRGYLRVFRTCRLFDYETHRWIDYDGTPLTRPLL